MKTWTLTSDIVNEMSRKKTKEETSRTIWCLAHISEQLDQAGLRRDWTMGGVGLTWGPDSVSLVLPAKTRFMT